MALHSLVVQSPFLRDLLKTVLDNYPGVVFGARRLEFSGNFEPLIHRFESLNNAIDSLAGELATEPSTSEKSSDENPSDNSTVDESVDLTAEPHRKQRTLEHAGLLRNLLATDLRSSIESTNDMKSEGVVNFDDLWALFEPGHLVYTRHNGQDRVFELVSGQFMRSVTSEESRFFLLTLKHVDFDGTRFGWTESTSKIPEFRSPVSITSLSAYPLRFHAASHTLIKDLVARASMFESLAGIHYRAYDGVAFEIEAGIQDKKCTLEGRIVIDTVGWNLAHSNLAIAVSPFDSRTFVTTDPCLESYSRPDLERMQIDGEFISWSYVPELIAGAESSKDNDTKNDTRLTFVQKLICTSSMHGYAPEQKKWFELFVSHVKDIKFNEAAFRSLVLPNNNKELILGFACSQQTVRESSNDVVQSKGCGVTMLLSGPPGVGKTFTVESVAEEMKVPLLVLTAADLGAEALVTRLTAFVGMCTRWNAILLLDEADTFLQELNANKPIRNKLVGSFRHVLEKHRGIVFLTANCISVSTFDLNAQSCIQISIAIEEPSKTHRRKIWENFLRQHDIASAEIHVVSHDEVRELSLFKINGRRIKNIVKAAQLLAIREGRPLSYRHIEVVRLNTQHLHNRNKELQDLVASGIA